MPASDILEAIASELENSDNVALTSSDEGDLEIVAEACVAASRIFREAAKKVKKCPCSKGKCECDEDCGYCKKTKKASLLTPEALEEIVAIAAEFDASGDHLLQKQASVLDEILLTIAAPKGLKAAAAEAEDKRIESLKKQYSETKENLDKNIKVSDIKKDIEKSPYYKQYRPLEEALSGRHCVDHPGVMVKRVAEHEYQCPLDGKVYNWETGFRTDKGNVIPGGSVDEQTKMSVVEPHEIFDTRESRLNK